VKPLGGRAYGSIGHLLTSRLGPGDHHVHEGQHRIATEACRRGDTIIVQEKLDGSCCAVALAPNGELLALGRKGYLATTSPYPMHHLFAHWVAANEDRFRAVLRPNERIVGEWLDQAHGTRYRLPHEPWVAFDIFDCAGRRLTVEQMGVRLGGIFVMPKVLSVGPPISILEALDIDHLGNYGHHGALEPAEGLVYRVEREGRVDFLAKYVRHGKVDGRYLKMGDVRNELTAPLFPNGEVLRT
jgi:hypothetical protein